MYDPKNLKKLGKLGASAPDPWKSFIAFDQAAVARHSR